MGHIWEERGEHMGEMWGNTWYMAIETHHNQSCSSPLEVNDSRQGYEIDHTWGVGSNLES